MKFSIYHKRVYFFFLLYQLSCKRWDDWRLKPQKINLAKPLTSYSFIGSNSTLVLQPVRDHLAAEVPLSPKIMPLPFPSGQTPPWTSQWDTWVGEHSLGVVPMASRCCDTERSSRPTLDPAVTPVLDKAWSKKVQCLSMSHSVAMAHPLPFETHATGAKVCIRLQVCHSPSLKTPWDAFSGCSSVPRSHSGMQNEIL